MTPRGSCYRAGVKSLRGVVLLLGMRGCGKSAVGAALASSTGARFVDLDAEVLRREGFASVADLWRAHGQDAFRRAEVDTLRATLDGAGWPLVVALGGGTPTAPGALDALRDATARGAAVVYLRCSLATLEARLRDSLAKDANRPSVTGDDPVRELGPLLAQREPAYRAAATVEIDGEGGTVEEVASRVREAVDQAASR